MTLRSVGGTDTPAEFGSLTCSPDGESRGKIARAGDVFPLDPAGHFFTAGPDAPSDVRPWGLRYARPATIRAGKHEGGTRETSGTTDGGGPGEEMSGV